ncbi:MAG: SdpI family protein [Firmicutes bacterium]|nr:SdpI family protein [Bacillota bacterium]
MKKNRSILFMTLLCLLPMVIGLVIYNKLPEELPIHFNMEGIADDYAPKSFTVFGMPLFFVVMNLIVYFAIRFDPKNHNQNSLMMKLPLYFIPFLGNIIIGMIYMMGLGMNFNITSIIILSSIVLMILLGNYLPKCRQNYTIGIKVPWTLNSERNWNMTHRFAGYLWVITGVVSLICLFILPREIFTIIFFVGLGVMVVVPIVYSFMLYRKGI